MPKVKTTKSVFATIGKTTNAVVSCDEVELPELDKNGILVKVIACGLMNSSYDSTSLCHLFSKSNKNLSIGVGSDVAGIVQAIGSDVTTLKVGDSVVGIVPLDYEQSGCSHFVVLQEFDVIVMSPGITFVDAAACIGDSVKAYTALHYLGRLTSGSTVLVLDGATSFGSVCIQLALHWGSKVLTTSSSNDEKTYLQTLNIEQSHIVELNQKNASLKSTVMLETGNLGVDIIIDQGIARSSQTIGVYGDNKINSEGFYPTKHEIISCLAVGGRWVTSRANLQLDPPNSRQLYLRCATVGFLFEQAWMLSSAQQGRYQHILMDVMEKVATGIIRPNVHHSISFEEVPEAVKTLEENYIGKVIMTT